ncbi:hypothetical protein ANCCAN_19714 [Ancylostoma caninum]|uniref:Uncharacterized protein n=1 Tax=Ancylostoma caninum TaxID=29170 RepID=A0A368FQE5_ANCCA|nr:hypothetical protein ANCCAN_19714 [Ancylostoma caninum]
MSQYQQSWATVLGERQYFNIQASRLDMFVTVQASFLETNPVQLDAKVPVRVCLTSRAAHAISLSAVVVGCDVERRRRVPPLSDNAPLLQTSRSGVVLEPNASTSFVIMLDLSTAQLQKGQTLWISRICLELGDRHSKMFGQLEFNLDFPPISSPIRIKPELGSNALRIAASDGGLVADASTTQVTCLVAEIASATLKLKNTCGHNIEAVR